MRVSRIALSLPIVALAVASLLAQSRPGGGAARTATNASATTTAGTSATSATSTTGTAATTTNNVQQTLQEILEEPTSGETYRYDPQGRRDPFQSLIGPAPRLQPGQRPPGVPGFLIDEIKLSGIVRTKQGLVGMIQGPDNKGYLIRAGEKLLDGEVIRVTPTSLVFRQEVNDPTRIERYREVVKELAPEAKK
jgi:Tfp pilus assembly protein PilP